MKHGKRKKVTQQRLVHRKPQQRRKRNDQVRKRLARPMTAAECEALQAEIRATMWEDML